MSAVGAPFRKNKPILTGDLLSLTVKNVNKSVDDRSPMAKSLSKVSEIMAICLMMIVPGLIGYVIDQKIGTRFVFTLLGLVFGMTGSVMQLMRLVASTETIDDSSTKTDDTDRTE